MLRQSTHSDVRYAKLFHDLAKESGNEVKKAADKYHLTPTAVSKDPHLR
jgi:predicted transcriptional regulator